MLVERDWCDDAGAAALAERIRAFWAAQGHEVECTLVVVVEKRDYGDRNTRRVMGVVSNLVDGLPPKREPQA